MAEEDRDEKTEPATPRKRQEAREKGQVAKSTDLNISILLLAVFGAMWFLGDGMLGTLRELAEDSFRRMGEASFTEESAVALMGRCMVIAASVVLPVILTVVIFALLVNFAQVGAVLSAQTITPQISRIDPISGFRRIFSVRSVMRLVMAVTKIVIIGAVLWVTSRAEVAPLIALLEKEVGSAVLYGAEAVFRMGVRTALVLLIIAILDYSYQRWQHERDLRMTKQEVKEELIRHEGNPRIRERRRQIQRQLAMRRIAARVPKAAVVITNPTHVAVAIRYDVDETPAPQVVAKGADEMALRIRRIAMEHRIPIVEKPELARALFQVPVDDAVPSALWRAVAEVLAYAYQLTGRVPRAAEVA